MTRLGPILVSVSTHHDFAQTWLQATLWINPTLLSRMLPTYVHPMSTSHDHDPTNPSTPVSGLLTGDGLTRVDAAYANALRITTLLSGAPVAICATVADFAWVAAQGIPSGILALGAWLALAVCAIVLPSRRFMRIGYRLADDELRVAHGLFFRTDTIVPFVRVQHIDLEQGPVERQYGLSSLVVHTSGTHNSTVTLPGLRTEVATAMRDTIRRQILSDFA